MARTDFPRSVERFCKEVYPNLLSLEFVVGLFNGWI